MPSASPHRQLGTRAVPYDQFVVCGQFGVSLVDLDNVVQRMGDIAERGGPPAPGPDSAVLDVVHGHPAFHQFTRVAVHDLGADTRLP